MSAPLRYALFLGCTIPARARNYELSARKVAARLGIELVDLPEFVCCGFPVKSADRKKSEVMGAYNLALAQKNGLDLCVLCSSCASALAETAHLLEKDEAVRREVNETLSKAGLRYEGGVKVRHFARILYQEVGLDRIRPTLTRSLKGLLIAPHYGCHYLKPSEIHDSFDPVEDPHTLDELFTLTGAEVVEYGHRKRCCGGPVLAVDEGTALAVAKEKLDDILSSGANAIGLVCPFCSVMYDSNQKGVESRFGKNYGLPVFYLSQVLGLAMGMDRKEVGLNMNVVKPAELLNSLNLEGL
jgi:heterodisulfide reductase subunit B2